MSQIPLCWEWIVAKDSAIFVSLVENEENVHVAEYKNSAE